MPKRKKSDLDKSYKYPKATDDISAENEGKESNKNKKKLLPKKKNWNGYIKENNLDKTNYKINKKKQKKKFPMILKKKNII